MIRLPAVLACLPTVGAMDVPCTELRPFPGPDLIEDKDGVITDRIKVAVVGCPFLLGPYTGLSKLSMSRMTPRCAVHAIPSCTHRAFSLFFGIGRLLG